MLFISNVFIVLLLSFVSCIKCAKLNVPRVLLPYNHDTPSKFTLKVIEGGCYTWTCSRDEVLLEEISYNGCSNEAVVSAVSKSKTRLTAIILAKDIETGSSLRCDVIIDAIHRLEIVTTTRELYAEEAPEEFEVRAYDDQENEFSTLEGLIFNWKLETIAATKSTISGETVLRFIPFEASSYETPPAIGALEARGKQGNRVLIEGSQTGVAKLSVRLEHPAYQELPSAEVQLMVIANLFLHPPNAYILPRTTVTYSVFHLKQGVFHPVDIEGSHYSLRVISENIATLEEDGISVTGLDLGTTLITLKDNNVKSLGTQKYPTASLHVVEPSYLTITIMPHNYPALIVGNHYTFVVDVYDKNGNVIFLTDNVIIETVVPEEFISTTFISKNGSYIDGIPFEKGATKITAKLSAIQAGDQVLEISPPLKTSLPLDIYDRLRVLPPLTLLPWDPITRPLYKINLTVEGGHGSVTWSSSDSHVVQVNALGHCLTKDKGEANVTAALAINPHNKDDAQIRIEEALKLDILDGVVEVEVGQPLYLAVAMSTSHRDAETFFMQCYQLPLKVEIEGTSFSSHEFEPPTGEDRSCVQARLQSERPGFSTVAVSYDGSRGVLRDVAIVSAFRPLRPKNPVSGETVLALLTSRIVLFEGGPLPWDNKLKGHYARIGHENSDIGSAELIGRASGKKAPADVYAVLVECHQLGEFTLSLTVGNKPSNSLPFPVEVSSSVTVICALPDTIAINAATALRQGCPFSRDSRLVVTQCYKPLPIEVSLLDSEGRTFDNISSLAISWEVLDASLASFPEKEASLSKTQVEHGFHLPLTAERILEPSGTPGEVTVTTTLTGYKEDLSHLSSFLPLQDSVKIMLVKDAQLTPAELVLFNHKNTQGEILVSGGSGHFQMAIGESKIASFRYESQNSTIIASPLADGTVNLTLVDLCLEPLMLPSTTIRVSSLSSLDLLMRDRVEVGSSIEAEVIAMDSLGRHIPVHSLMKLTPHPRDINIIVPRFEAVNEKGNALLYVYGKKIGETMLRVSCKKGTGNVFSPTRPIQVFPSLTILPKNITLIIGAVFQVETRGGPYHDATIEFLMENETIAQVSSAGVVTALSLGTSRITARAISQLSDGHPFVVDSQDWVTVNVIPLEAIRIHAPLRYIETGSTMPLYAMGLDGSQNPLSYATANPPLYFEWSLSNKQIAAFTMVYAENDVVEPNENKGVVRLSAIKPGRVTVSLKVSVLRATSGEDYQILGDSDLVDEMEIRVFDSLKLGHPWTEDAKILLSPNAETKIRTNRENEENLSFKYSTEAQNCAAPDPLVTVSPEGVVKAGTIHGDASVIVTLEESFGVTQSISVLVEVRPISYIEAVATPFMKAAPNNVLPSIPLGSSHHLGFAFHDNRGRVFTAVDTALECRPSRFDLVDARPGLSNNSWEVTVRGDGQTVLHFWDRENAHINDFILINSARVIYPDRVNIPLGSPVCFSSALRDPSGKMGMWGSDSPALKIDPSTGTAVTLQVGNVSVWYQVSPSVTATTELNIIPIQKITVSSLPNPISNINREGGFFVDVTIEGENSYKSESSCFPYSSLQPYIPFTCLLSFATVLPGIEVKDVFTASATFLPDQGFGCLLESSFDSDSIFAASGAELLLGVSVIKFGPQEDVRTPMSTVPFYPAAVVEKSEVVLMSEDPAAVVSVYGHPELLSSFVQISEDSNINARIEDIEGSNGHLVISAQEMAWSSGVATSDRQTVSLVSSLTHQKIQVSVSFEESGTDTCIDPARRVGFVGLMTSLLFHYQNVILTLLCLGVTFGCLFWGYHSLVSPGYNQTQNTSVFASSPDVVPQPSPVGSSSPRNRPFSSIPSGSPEGLGRRVFSSSPTGIPLWSVDKEPVYGDPVFRSSPRPAYEGSRTYSPFSPS